MTDEQRRRMRDIETRAEPLFRELARVEDKIRYLRKCLADALDEKKKIEAQINILSDEKSEVWADIFSSKKNTKGG